LLVYKIRKYRTNYRTSYFFHVILTIAFRWNSTV